MVEEQKNQELKNNRGENQFFENGIREESRRLVSVKELAHILGVSSLTIYRWQYKDIIKPIKIGRLIRFDIKEIERMIFVEGKILYGN